MSYSKDLGFFETQVDAKDGYQKGRLLLQADWSNWHEVKLMFNSVAYLRQ